MERIQSASVLEPPRDAEVTDVTPARVPEPGSGATDRPAMVLDSNEGWTPHIRGQMNWTQSQWVRFG